MNILDYATRRPWLSIQLTYYGKGRMWRATVKVGDYVVAKGVGSTTALALDMVADKLQGEQLRDETVPALEVIR